MERAITDSQRAEIFRDYHIKIEEKLSGMSGELPAADDINNMVVLLNWCFCLRNNFFTKDFNRRRIFGISTAYKQLKTNILVEGQAPASFLWGIDHENLKILKYIINQYIIAFDGISADGMHGEICERVTIDSARRCAAYVGYCLQAVAP